ncbi:MAG: hypothetical protein AAF264_03525 [Pseudomonadota bacterium]
MPMRALLLLVLATPAAASPVPPPPLLPGLPITGPAVPQPITCAVPPCERTA